MKGKILSLIFMCFLFIRGQAQDYFHLVFEDATANPTAGFYDQMTLSACSTAGIISPDEFLEHQSAGRTTLGEVRRFVAAEVFKYIESKLVIHPGAYPNQVEVVFRASAFTPPSGGATMLAGASDFYTPASAGTTGIINTMPFTHITTGADPDANPNVPDMRIQVNFAMAFECHHLPNSPSSAGLDFFTVLLHEVTHAMGITSLIQVNGSSNRGGPYSAFDAQLVNIGGSHLIVGSNFDMARLGDLTGNNVSMDLPSFGGFRIPVASPDVFSFGSSLSHFDMRRSDYLERYVMSSQLAPGTNRREWTINETYALCQLGYTLKQNTALGQYGCVLGPRGIQDNYVYIVNPLNPREQCVDVLSNDIGTGGTRINMAYGNNGILNYFEEKCDARIDRANGKICITFKPNQCGDAMIAYQPMDNNGRLANPVMLMVKGPPCNGCPDDQCNLVCNGGFEQGVTSAIFETTEIMNDLDYSISRPSMSDFWWGINDELYVRGSQKANGIKGVNTGPTQGGIPDSYNSAPNNRFVGMYANPGGIGSGERILTRTVVPIQGGNNYSLHFQANPTYIFGATVYAYAVKELDLNNTANWVPIGSQAITPGWQLVPFTSFSLTGGPWDFLVIEAQGQGYVYIDDVVLENANGNAFSFKKTVTTLNTPYANPGETVTFKIELENTGSAPLKNVRFTDLFDNTAFGGILSSPPATIVTSGTLYDYWFTTILPGAINKKTITITATLLPGVSCRTVENCAKIYRMDDNIGNNILPYVCPKVEYCTDVIVGSGNLCPCGKDIVDLGSEDKYMCASPPNGETLLAPAYTPLTGGVLSYIWTDPANNTSIIKDKVLATPILGGIYRLQIFSTGNGLISPCLVATKEYNIHLLNQQSPAENVELTINCDPYTILNLPLYGDMVPGSYIVWQDESGNVIDNVEYHDFRNNDLVTGYLYTSSGCLLKVVNYTIHVDCCLKERVFNSFSKRFEMSGMWTDGSLATLATGDGGNLVSIHAFFDRECHLLKLNPQGRTQWDTRLKETNNGLSILKLLEHGGNYYAIGVGGRLAMIAGNGTWQWTKAYGDMDFHSAVLNADPQGGILILGSSGNPSDAIYHLMLVDFNGVVQWKTQWYPHVIFGGVPDGSHTRPSDLAQATIDGNVITVVTGYYDAGLSPIVSGIMLVRFNNVGAYVSHNLLQGTDIPKHIISTTDDPAHPAFVINGRTQSNGKAFLLKVDAGLNRLWSYTYDNTTSSVPVVASDDVIEAVDANNNPTGYLLMGYTNELKAVFQVKLDGTPEPAGINRTYQQSLNANEGFGNLNYTPEGGLFITAKAGLPYQYVDYSVYVIKTGPTGSSSCDHPFEVSATDHPLTGTTQYYTTGPATYSVQNITWTPVEKEWSYACCQHDQMFYPEVLCEKMKVNASFDFSFCHPNVSFTPKEYIAGAKYEWDFGDGTPKSNLPFPIHQYAVGNYYANYDYTVCLKVTYMGCTETKCISIHIDFDESENIEEYCPLDGVTWWWIDAMKYDPNHKYDHYIIHDESGVESDFNSQVSGHQDIQRGTGQYTISYFDANGCLQKILHLQIRPKIGIIVPCHKDVFVCNTLPNLEGIMPDCDGCNPTVNTTDHIELKPLEFVSSINGVDRYQRSIINWTLCKECIFTIDLIRRPPCDFTADFIYYFAQPNHLFMQNTTIAGPGTTPCGQISWSVFDLTLNTPIPMPFGDFVEAPGLVGHMYRICMTAIYCGCDGAACTTNICKTFIVGELPPPMGDASGGNGDNGTGPQGKLKSADSAILSVPQQFHNAFEVNIRPNPSSDRFTIFNLQGVEAYSRVIIATANGQEVLSYDNNSAAFEYNMAGYARGIYIVKVISGGDTRILKLVLQ